MQRWHEGCLQLAMRTTLRSYIPAWYLKPLSSGESMCILLCGPGGRGDNSKCISFRDAVIAARFFPHAHSPDSAIAWRAFYGNVSLPSRTTLVQCIEQVQHDVGRWSATRLSIVAMPSFVDYTDESQVGSHATRVSYSELTPGKMTRLASILERPMHFLRIALPMLAIGRKQVDILAIIFEMMTNVPYVGFDDPVWFETPLKTEALRRRIRACGEYQDHVAACDTLKSMGLPVSYPAFPDLNRLVLSPSSPVASSRHKDDVPIGAFELFCAYDHELKHSMEAFDPHVDVETVCAKCKYEIGKTSEHFQCISCIYDLCMRCALVAMASRFDDDASDRRSKRQRLD